MKNYIFLFLVISLCSIEAADRARKPVFKGLPKPSQENLCIDSLMPNAYRRVRNDVVKDKYAYNPLTGRWEIVGQKVVRETEEQPDFEQKSCNSNETWSEEE